MRIAFTRRAVQLVGLTLLASFCALSTGTSASAAGASAVPEQVETYFAEGLIPRLTDLYAPGADGKSGIPFDDTTTVGTIARVSVWTDAFRAGEQDVEPTQLTNDWVAPITLGADEQVGLSTVWISPHTNMPELANFVPSDSLGLALAAAPEGAILVRVEERSAWFAVADDRVIPLVVGDTGITQKSLSLSEVQAALLGGPPAQSSNTNRGFVIAGLTLGFVVVLLALFVLMPDRRGAHTDPDVELGFPPFAADDELESPNYRPESAGVKSHSEALLEKLATAKKVSQQLTSQHTAAPAHATAVAQSTAQPQSAGL